MLLLFLHLGLRFDPCDRVPILGPTVVESDLQIVVPDVVVDLKRAKRCEALAAPEEVDPV